MLAQVQQIALQGLPALPKVSEGHLAQCFRIMLANLPRKGSDEVSGEILIETYMRVFHVEPCEKIDFLLAEVVRRCRWFPTISECLEIMQEWERWDADTNRRFKAERMVADELRTRRAEFMERLRGGEIPQEKIDALPDNVIWDARLCGALVRDREAEKWVPAPPANQPDQPP